jgi:nucleotide-binding universal stress UspA family protein
MSYTEFAVIATIAWILIGVVTSFVMGRRGHDPFTWWLVGTVFGPLSIGYVIDRIRLERKLANRSSPRSDREAEGSVDVLIRIDGSPEAESAVGVVSSLLGPRIRRLTLATVLPYETPAWSETRRDANASMELAALRSTHVDAETVFLQGRPADELARFAKAGGFGLLAIGRRGKGLSTALLGSVASTLARTDGVPALIVGPGGEFLGPDPARC